MKTRYLYILLLALFVVAVTYQALFTVAAVREDLYGYQQVRRPFLIEDVEPIITRLRPEAEAAGLKVGDRVVAVDGRGVEGLRLVATRDSLKDARRRGVRLKVQTGATTRDVVVRLRDLV